MWRASSAVILSRFVLNQMTIERVVGMEGAGKIQVALSEDSSVGQSVRAQLGVGGGARKSGASNRRRIGIWSEPVEGRGSVHSVK